MKKYSPIKRRKILTISIFLLLFCHLSFAQTFTGKGGDILDYSNSFYRNFFPIEVDNLPESINCDFGLTEVCITIQHRRSSDLKVTLLSPDGNEIWLTNRNGGNQGSNYTNTCFSNTGFNGFIYDGISPFTGQYLPDGQMENLNNSQNPNGIWFLIIEDLREGIIGELLHFSISFGKEVNCSKSKCRKENIGACDCPNSEEDCLLLPDLVILKDLTAKQWKWFPEEHPDYPNQIRLGVGMANIGHGPMEIKGTNQWFCPEGNVENEKTKCQDGSNPYQKIEQLVFQKKGNKLDTIIQTGGNLYFESAVGHNHYHADDWVDFVLLKKIFWRKNPKKWKVIGRSRKVSYCLFDSNRCRENPKNCKDGNQHFSPQNMINYGLGGYESCNSDRQGISVGGIDYYGMMYEGQSIKFSKPIKKGTYYLLIEVDPENHYRELNEENNIVLIKINIP